MTKNYFKGIVQRAAHTFTKGKETKDILICIEVLEGVIAKYKEILIRRNIS